MAGKDTTCISGFPEEAYTNDTVDIEVDEPNETTDMKDTSTPFNWPSLHLLSGESRALYFGICVPLQNAALKGDIKEVYKCSFGIEFRSVLRAAITDGYETILHVATGAGKIRFVKELVNLMEAEDLTLQDKKGSTAFSYSAATGNLQIAKIMLEKNPTLLTIRGSRKKPPLYIAALFGQGEMASFLYNKTKQDLTEEDRKDIFFISIDTGLYDLALALLEDDEELAAAGDMEYGGKALHVLAKNPSAFDSSSAPRLLKRLISLFPELQFTYKPDLISTQEFDLVKCELLKETIQKEQRKDVDAAQLIFKGELSNLLFEAAKSGNFKFLAELIHFYPDLVHQLEENDRSIFHIAALNHDTNTMNLINKIGFAKELLTCYVDKDQNNLLHLAAKYQHRSLVNTGSGAALQLHREVRMFKEVEMLVKPFHKEMKNSEGKTPREIFIMEHSELLKSGELWMKNTSSSCAIVATLVTILICSAAFIVPSAGGSNDEMGISINLRNSLFRVFAVTDAIALSCSSVSLMIFLSILTSHISENDFLWSLPVKLTVGLSALFISIMGMLIAFISVFFIAYHHRLISCIPLLTLLLASAATSLIVALRRIPVLKP